MRCIGCLLTPTPRSHPHRCYEIAVGGGSTDSEIGFELIGNLGEHFQDLSAPYSDHFCVAGGDLFDHPTPSPSISALPSALPSPVPTTAAPTETPTENPTPMPTGAPTMFVTAGAAVLNVTLIEGGARNVTIILTKRPPAAVTLRVDSPDAVVYPRKMTFEPDAWFVPQMVKATIAQNLVDQGLTYKIDFNVTARCTSTASECGEFDGLQQTISLRVTDDDTAGIAISKTPVRVIVDALGSCYSSGQFQFQLKTRPQHNVSVTVVPSATYMTLAPNLVVFTPNEWNRSKKVEVFARSPLVEEYSAFLTYNMSSKDPFYDGRGTSNTTVHVEVREESPVPELAEAVFWDNGAGMTVVFTEDTNGAGLSGVWDCGRLFNNSLNGPGGYLGSSSSCAWVDALTVGMTFGSKATALPGDQLFMKDNHLQSTFAGAVLFSHRQNVSIDNAVNPVLPVPMISSPQSIGLCDDLKLDAGLSSGSGGRDLTFNWTLVVEKGSDYSKLTNVTNQLLEATRQNTDVVSIVRAHIPPKTTLTFALNIRNFLGSSGLTTAQVTKTGMPAPLAFIQGQNPKTTTRSEALSLVLSAWQPQLCAGVTLGTSIMQFSWAETTGRFATTGGTLSAVNPRVLSVPEDILVPGATYEFEAFVSMDGYRHINSTASVAVHVVHQALVAAISGGTTREVGRESWLRLDASSSWDPDGENSRLQYSWSCMNRTGITTTLCANASGHPLAASIPVSSANATLSLPPMSLDIGKYEFTVVVSKESRNSSASTNIHITPGSPPVVSIAALTQSLYNANDGAYLALYGTATSLTSAIKTTEWTQDAGGYVSGGAFAVSTAQLKTALALGRLTPGGTYIFRLTATDIEGSSAMTEVSVSINLPPTSGTFSVSPIKG